MYTYTYTYRYLYVCNIYRARGRSGPAGLPDRGGRIRRLAGPGSWAARPGGPRAVPAAPVKSY